MAAQETFNEHLDSLTGFEELAIAQHFGFDITTLLDRSPSMAGRALIFSVHAREKETSPSDAYKAAMGLTMREVDDYFAAEEVEIDEDEPETEQGKDDSVGN